RSDPSDTDQRARRRSTDRRPQSHQRRRMVRRATVGHRGNLQDLRGKLPRHASSPANPGRCAANCGSGARARDELEDSEEPTEMERMFAAPGGKGTGDQGDPCVMVIFGASGDLTKRKLIPALYNLAKDNLLSREFALLGFARPDWSSEQFRDKCSEDVKK